MSDTYSEAPCTGPAAPLSLREAQRAITSWADEVFPNRTVKGTLSKMMCEELPEFITSEMRDPLEYADLLILVLDLAGQMNIDVEDALARKMKINRDRKWRRDPDTGNWRHVKQEELPREDKDRDADPSVPGDGVAGERDGRQGQEAAEDADARADDTYDVHACCPDHH